MKNKHYYWYDYWQLIVVLSLLLQIFKDGWLGTVLLWGYYLWNGFKNTKKINEQWAYDIFAKRLILGIIIVVLSVAFQIRVLIKY